MDTSVAQIYAVIYEEMQIYEEVLLIEQIQNCLVKYLLEYPLITVESLFVVDRE